ncbi:hypothetical protein QFZ22_000147 [Streptomyces canus]|uniref:Uncharacterized protein n=1 Tax=Streptomyces canus TaxID=58343 RepID=A0AAW8F652_9ACTN|nr:hypothetical protein [Streptomyces canus]MDQ0904162.1 hypothetical protein [Streptomyces canus]
MYCDPWLVTFRLLDEAGTRHSYVIKDATDAFAARAAARKLADSPTEQAARHGAAIDPRYDDVLALNPIVLAHTLHFEPRTPT